MEEHADVTARHEAHYRLVEQRVLRRVEARVTGCDYGATSYTTRAQADRVGRMLDLSPGKLFLDVGSGAGWPGIYLAATTGARVVLTDIPLEGLRVARRRLEHDRVGGDVVAASGSALPFPDHTFAAVTSSDVLC